MSLLLLLVNFGLLAFLFFNRPPRRGLGKENMSHHRLFAELDLKETEQTAFLQSKNKHQQGMRALTEQKKELLRDYFNALLPGKSINLAQQDSLLAQIDSIESGRIKLTYRHFEEVKGLVASENEAAYASFVEMALGRLLLPSKEPNRRREKEE